MASPIGMGICLLFDFYVQKKRAVVLLWNVRFGYTESWNERDKRGLRRNEQCTFFCVLLMQTLHVLKQLREFLLAFGQTSEDTMQVFLAQRIGRVAQHFEGDAIANKRMNVQCFQIRFALLR